MKIQVKGTETKVTPYPKLMIAGNGDIVLFKEYEKGTVVVSGDKTYMIGQHSRGWDMGCFIDFGGSITLSND